ncbi:MAG: YbjN domain-containing protein [Chloroflexota bacterium]
MLFSGRNRSSRTKSLEHHAETVERILHDMDVDIENARIDVDRGYGWTFKRGSAIIEVYIVEQEGRGYLQTLAPIMHLPETGLLPLYRRLLEYNLQLTNASLGVYFDVVYVFNERPLVALDAQEVNTIVTMVAGYADDLDNTLVNEFGGRLYSQI